MLTGNIVKTRIWAIVTSLAVALLLILYGATLPGKIVAAESTEEQAAKKVLNVTGQGTVNASPDIAYITLSVVTEHANAKTAQQNNADAMSKVVNAIKSAGIKSEDIKTVNFNIYPKYDYNKDTGESGIFGYTVNNTIQVIVRDINKTGSIIDLASASGVNTSSSITFGLSNYEKYYNEALKSAVQVAKGRAETIAGTLGISLKTPVTITESGGFEPPVAYGARYDMKEMESAATPVESGTITVRASVSMTYEF